MASKKTLNRLAPWLFLAVIILLWEGITVGFNVSQFIFPSFSASIKALFEYIGPISVHAWQTFWTTMVGFGIGVVVGLILGFIVGSSRFMYDGLYPLLVGFNSIPKAAFVPILVVWFGIGTVPAILTAFLISFFPIVVNVATGLATMEPELEDVLRALGAKKLDIMLKVGIPRTQPYLFGSLKVAITLAFVGTVVSETIGANAGLGYQIALAGSNFQMPLVFAALLLLAIEGTVMYAVFAYVEVCFTRWAFRSSMSAAT